MTEDKDSSSAFTWRGMRLSSIWREVGVLLLSVSLILLPWFLDRSPSAEIGPRITGVELVTHNGWPLILGYASVWLSYGISRFSNKKWVGMIFLVAAWILYVYIQAAFTSFGGRFVESLNRGSTSFDLTYPALAGVWVNWLGLISLTLGLFLAERGQGRTAVWFAGSGAILGTCLLVWLLYENVWSYPGIWPHSVGPFWHQVSGGIQLLGPPLGGALLGIWIALTGRPERTAEEDNTWDVYTGI